MANGADTGDASMKGAEIVELGEAPILGTVPRPVPGSGQALIEVLAAAINPVDVAIASGRIFGEALNTPFVIGYEAVGKVVSGDRLPEGSLVWFVPPARAGTFAEYAVAAEATAIPLPPEVDVARAAALGIAGQTGWLAVSWRAAMTAGETILVLGATGPVGRVAVQAAKALGAARVVAAGRDRDALQETLSLGADATVELGGERADLTASLRAAAGGEFDVIIDPVWGPPAVAAIDAAAQRARLVQIGHAAEREATIASGAMRRTGLDLLAFQLDQAPPEARAAAYRQMLGLEGHAGVDVPVMTYPLSEVAAAWHRLLESPHAKVVLEIA